MALGLHRPVLKMKLPASVDDGDLKVGDGGPISLYQSNHHILYHFEDQRDFLRIEDQQNSNSCKKTRKRRRTQEQ